MENHRRRRLPSHQHYNHEVSRVQQSQSLSSTVSGNMVLSSSSSGGRSSFSAAKAIESRRRTVGEPAASSVRTAPSSTTLSAPHSNNDGVDTLATPTTEICQSNEIDFGYERQLQRHVLVTPEKHEAVAATALPITATRKNRKMQNRKQKQKKKSQNRLKPCAIHKPKLPGQQCHDIFDICDDDDFDGDDDSVATPEETSLLRMTSMTRTLPKWQDGCGPSRTMEDDGTTIVSSSSFSSSSTSSASSLSHGTSFDGDDDDDHEDESSVKQSGEHNTKKIVCMAKRQDDNTSRSSSKDHCPLVVTSYDSSVNEDYDDCESSALGFSAGVVDIDNRDGEEPRNEDEPAEEFLSWLDVAVDEVPTSTVEFVPAKSPRSLMCMGAKSSDLDVNAVSLPISLHGSSEANIPGEVMSCFDSSPSKALEDEKSFHTNANSPSFTESEAMRVRVVNNDNESPLHMNPLCWAGAKVMDSMTVSVSGASDSNTLTEVEAEATSIAFEERKGMTSHEDFLSMAKAPTDEAATEDSVALGGAKFKSSCGRDRVEDAKATSQVSVCRDETFPTSGESNTQHITDLPPQIDHSSFREVKRNDILMGQNLESSPGEKRNEENNKQVGAVCVVGKEEVIAEEPQSIEITIGVPTTPSSRKKQRGFPSPFFYENFAKSDSNVDETEVGGALCETEFLSEEVASWNGSDSAFFDPTEGNNLWKGKPSSSEYHSKQGGHNEQYPSDCDARFSETIDSIREAISLRSDHDAGDSTPTEESCVASGEPGHAENWASATLDVDPRVEMGRNTEEFSCAASNEDYSISTGEQRPSRACSVDEQCPSDCDFHPDDIEDGSSRAFSASSCGEESRTSCDGESAAVPSIQVDSLQSKTSELAVHHRQIKTGAGAAFDTTHAQFNHNMKPRTYLVSSLSPASIRYEKDDCKPIYSADATSQMKNDYSCVSPADGVERFIAGAFNENLYEDPVQSGMNAVVSEGPPADECCWRQGEDDLQTTTGPGEQRKEIEVGIKEEINMEHKKARGEENDDKKRLAQGAQPKRCLTAVTVTTDDAAITLPEDVNHPRKVNIDTQKFRQGKASNAFVEDSSNMNLKSVVEAHCCRKRPEAPTKIVAEEGDRSNGYLFREGHEKSESDSKKQASSLEQADEMATTKQVCFVEDNRRTTGQKQPVGALRLSEPYSLDNYSREVALQDMQETHYCSVEVSYAMEEDSTHSGDRMGKEGKEQAEEVAQRNDKTYLSPLDDYRLETAVEDKKGSHYCSVEVLLDEEQQQRQNLAMEPENYNSSL